jgi:phosphoserine aminotransferase
LAEQMIRVGASGASVLELADRSLEGAAMLAEIERLARVLLAVPDDFSVLIVPGGGTHQFVSIAYSFRRLFACMQFVETDYWTTRARVEASVFMKTDTLFDGAESGFRHLPSQAQIQRHNPVGVTFLTSNNTTAGTQWTRLPMLRTECRVVDMSSDIFATVPEYDSVDVVLACAQKHFGVAGMSLLLVRTSLLERARSVTGYLSLASWHNAKGRYNTFPMTLAAVVLECLRFIEATGVRELRERCERCSNRLYLFLDDSAAFSARITDRDARSRHNVTFELRDADERAYDRVLDIAAARGLKGLKGHPSVGGFRASFYFGAQERDAIELVNFLSEMDREVLHGNI